MLSTMEAQRKLREAALETDDNDFKVAVTKALEWLASRDYLRDMLTDAYKINSQLHACLDRAVNAKLP